MRKKLSVLLSAVLCVGLLAGCGGAAKEPAAEAAEATVEAAEDAGEAAAEETAEAAEETAEAVEETAEATEETAEAATEEAAEAAEEPAEEAADAASGEKLNIKAGFITLHDENSTYDLNFINAAKAACEQLGIEVI